MKIPKAGYVRTFLEAGIPTWAAIATLLFLERSRLNLAGLLVMIFPGAWSAFRLRTSGHGLPRVLSIAMFLMLQGLALAGVLLAAAIVLSSAGQAGSSTSASDVLFFLVAFATVPAVTFLLVRGALALPGAIRKPRRLVVPTISTVIVIALLAGGYVLISEPYVRSAMPPYDPPIASAVLLDGFTRVERWRPQDQGLQLASEAGALRVDFSRSNALYHAMTWSIPAGMLAAAEGLRMRARADAAMSLFVEVHEADGARYRTWLDLPAGDWAWSVMADFSPYLGARDSNSTLDWDQADALTLYAFLNQPATNLWLEQMQAIHLKQPAPVWQVRATDHFWIRYHPSEETVASDVARAAEDQFARISTTLGYRPVGLLPITIVSSHAELEQRQRGPKPEWAHANAFPDSLDILTPRLYSQIFNGHSYSDIFRLVPHETVHVFEYQLTGYPGIRDMPMWLNEGLAIYLAGQDRNEARLLQAAKDGTLIPFTALNSPFRNQPDPVLSYAMAASLTDYLVATYGFEPIPRLLDQLSSGSDFATAFQLVTGTSQDAFQQQWESHVRARAK